MATLGGISRRLEVLADDVERGADKVVRTTALVIDQALVTSMPVDTGTARSNVIVTTGRRSREVRQPYAPGKRLGRGEGANAAAAMQQGSQAIASRPRGASIHIVDNVHYVADLDRGSSPQAPAGFIDQAILIGIRAGRAVGVL